MGCANAGRRFSNCDTNAKNPLLTTVTTANGLSSNAIIAVTEDLQGRMYFATGRGVDRYEPETGRIKHFTTADGLASNHFIDATRDRHGNLWFATLNGISRFAPKTEPPAPAPPIYVSGLRVGDENFPVPSKPDRRRILFNNPRKFSHFLCSGFQRL